MNDKPTRIIIPRAGISTGDSRPRAVYDHRSSKLMDALGQVETRRASNVESGSSLGQKALASLYNSGYATRWWFLWWYYKILPEYANHWFADMTPSDSRTVLGPYSPADREVALHDEVAWLNARNIPACYDCGTLTSGAKTGRWSSTNPPRTNFQHVDMQLPPGKDIADLDFSAIEQRVLSHMRREKGEQLFASTTVCEEVEAVNGWEEDGDTLRRTFFVPGKHQSIKMEFSVVFFNSNTWQVEVHPALT